MSLADLPDFAMVTPASLDALCELTAERHARGQATVLLAGGTDWVVEQEMRRPRPPAEEPPLVADVSRMPALRGIRWTGDTATIGAGVTYLELRRDELVQTRLPLLARMARDVGAVQIQARGTLGGNLGTASPAADGVAALAALDASVLVRSVRGERTVAFRDLQTGYKQSTRAADEVIVAVSIVAPTSGSAWAWRKVGARRAQAISKVALAAVAELEGGRARRFGLGMASVAPVTALLAETRALVLARPLAELAGEDVDRAVEADIAPLDDVRSTRVYRLHCAKALVRSFLRALGAPV